eukprot:14024628-Alexandrium_andersonii.AAC.1
MRWVSDLRWQLFHRPVEVPAWRLRHGGREVAPDHARQVCHASWVAPVAASTASCRPAERPGCVRGQRRGG